MAAMNKVQFQAGMSLGQFLHRYGDEAKCEDAVEKQRWPKGYARAGCGHHGHYVARHGRVKTFQCFWDSQSSAAVYSRACDPPPNLTVRAFRACRKVACAYGLQAHERTTQFAPTPPRLLHSDNARVCTKLDDDA